MSPLQNKCLYLTYVKGLSYKQIARKLSGHGVGYKERQIKYQIHLAKCRILSYIPNK
ncbi:MAG: sigma factor-like helix-turn-helix DNA-binding protein [Candidatus Hodarchaeales archaeon]